MNPLQTNKTLTPYKQMEVKLNRKSLYTEITRRNKNVKTCNLIIRTPLKQVKANSFDPESYVVSAPQLATLPVLLLQTT